MMPHLSGGIEALKGFCSSSAPHFFWKNSRWLPNLAQSSAWAMSLAVIIVCRAAYHGGVRCAMPGDRSSCAVRAR